MENETLDELGEKSELLNYMEKEVDAKNGRLGFMRKRYNLFSAELSKIKEEKDKQNQVYIEEKKKLQLVASAYEKLQRAFDSKNKEVEDKAKEIEKLEAQIALDQKELSKLKNVEYDIPLTDCRDFGELCNENRCDAVVESNPEVTPLASQKDTPQGTQEQESKEDNIDPDDKSLVTIDFGEYFQTEEVFESRDKLICWAKEIGRRHMFVVMIGKSAARTSSSRPRLQLCCERGGDYRSHVKKTNQPLERKRKRKRNTTKCNCPFKLKGIPSDDGTWKVKVICGYHNHELAKGRSRMNCEEKIIVENLVKIGMNPRQILSQLHERFDDNNSTVKAIYNVQSRLRRSNTEELNGAHKVEEVESLKVEEAERPNEEAERPDKETNRPNEEAERPDKETDKPNEKAERPDKETDRPNEEADIP